ncbi:MAG: DUF5606 domain-containing protein [Bacteroidales bacterium]|nr:DUF5606 domain-containing protein [Bacteroidales bacterium]
MDLKKILTISGQPDLFEMITNTPKGIVVESIITKKRSQAFASQRVNSLEDIAVYTLDGEIPLKEVFVKIYQKEEGGQAPSHKDDVLKIKQYFEDFFPDYDKDRVKLSAMKRILKWYNLLNENNLVDDKIENETEEEVKEEKSTEETK